MREEDLKKLCPQMLMEYFEDNDMKIWNKNDKFLKQKLSMFD